ncbi:DNA-directed RNA polymerase subunit alpha, partial [Staphylococcus aureus]|nr:DNA-directed RNA polymerase subunit alpha [Staphylococcus aureus]
MTVNIKNWQELKKPNNLEIKPGNDAQRRAPFVAEPPARGSGPPPGTAPPR